MIFRDLHIQIVPHLKELVVLRRIKGFAALGIHCACFEGGITCEMSGE